MMKYNQDLEEAINREEEIKVLFKKMKRKKSNALDQAFHREHDKAFEKIDCLECANCCKTTSPIFRDVDVSRIAKKFKTSVPKFEKEYLKRDEDGDLVLKQSPCPFLEFDNKCFIYDVRPLACREYPHTNRKRMGQVLDITLNNTKICPAVSRIALALNKEFT